MLLHRHRGPLTADFRRFYSMRLSDALTTLPFAEVASLAAYLPVESAVARIENPEWWVTPEVLQLRDAVFELEVLAWQQTKDGTKGRNPPKWRPITKAEQEMLDRATGKQHFDLMTVDQAREMLGWTAAA